MLAPTASQNHQLWKHLPGFYWNAAVVKNRPGTEVVARFVAERQMLAKLEHPNIVPVYELGRREDGRLYYTMKLVRGRTLTLYSGAGIVPGSNADDEWEEIVESLLANERV